MNDIKKNLIGWPFIVFFFLGRWSLLIFHIVNSFLHVRGGDLHYIILYFSFAFSCIYVGPFRTHTHTYTHTHKDSDTKVSSILKVEYTHTHITERWKTSESSYVTFIESIHHVNFLTILVISSIIRDFYE